MRIVSRILQAIGILCIVFSFGALDAIDNLVTAVIAMLCMFSGGCLMVLIGSELDYIKLKKRKVPASTTNRDKHTPNDNIKLSCSL